MKTRVWCVGLTLGTLLAVLAMLELVRAQDVTPVSFKQEIFPLIKKNCLPCHAEENFNPSELSLDSYELLMKGGKHGPSVVPGKSGESLFLKKLGANPPFGKRMPVDPRKKRSEPSTLKLEDREIDLIARWIDQGARNN